MNDSQTITNETLYELIKEFKRDVYKRFEQQDARFEQVDKRFEQVIDLIKNEKHEREKTEAKLEKIYESRDQVSVSFTRSWMFASFFLALLSATVVLAVDKAF